MTKRSTTGDTPKPGDLLFAYGTLQRGGQYHYFLERCKAVFLEKGTTTLPYPLIIADYPCLLDQPGKGTQVKGELFRIIHPEDWRDIDRLEDHPNEYIRRPEPIRMGDQILEAWTYFYQFPERLPAEGNQ